MEVQTTDSVTLIAEFFEHAPVLFSCYDENMRMLAVNQTTVRFLKKQHKSELIGLTLEEISPGITATGRAAQYAEVMHTGKPMHLRAVVTVPALGSREVGTYAFPVGKGFGIIAIDVSEWIAKERAMITQLEQKNKELEQFAYVASHDLQEPLETISSYLGVIGKKYSDKLDEKGATYFDFVLQAARRMQALVRNLLEYSRIGRTEKQEVVDCNQILNEVRADLAVLIQSTGANVRVQPLPKVLGNATEIRQLFLNLIQNAIKFHGTEPPVVDIGATRKGAQWQFHVRDNGIGIDEKYFDRIFVIFQRLHNRSQYEGTGIGLTLCKKIVEMHGGRIGVSSHPGEGANFYFTLNTTDDEEKTPADTAD